MKWDKPNGPTQHTTDKRYCVVHATEENWIAYKLGPTTGEDIGTVGTDAGARHICELHERNLTRQRA